MGAAKVCKTRDIRAPCWEAGPFPLSVAGNPRSADVPADPPAAVPDRAPAGGARRGGVSAERRSGVSAERRSGVSGRAERRIGVSVSGGGGELRTSGSGGGAVAIGAVGTPGAEGAEVRLVVGVGSRGVRGGCGCVRTAIAVRRICPKCSWPSPSTPPAPLGVRRGRHCNCSDGNCRCRGESGQSLSHGVTSWNVERPFNAGRGKMFLPRGERELNDDARLRVALHTLIRSRASAW